MGKQAPPLGFGARGTHKRSATMLLAVRLTAGEMKSVSKLTEQGADLLLVDDTDPSRLKRARKDAPDSALGVEVSGLGSDAAAELRKAGADFAVIATTAEASALLEEKLGFVLALDDEVSDITLRTLRELPVEALIAPALEAPLTINRQLDLIRISSLSGKPLLTQAAGDIPEGQLRALRDAGVVGIILAGDEKHIGDLRKGIDSLPPRGERSKERMDAILPLMHPAAVEPDADEEE